MPYTQDGELPGSRTEFIQWIQDVRDQRGILRNYVKYDNELRTGRNVKQLVHRALQIARSEPAGPVYLTGAREVMEERIEPYQVDAGSYPPVAPAALTAEVAAEIATALAGARHPLIVTSYLGRDPAAVPSLVALAELLAIPVLEAMAYHVNFPDDHPLHAGFQYHSTGQNPVLAEADVILVLDSDVPWIPSVNRPAAGAAIYYVDIDPLKSQMQLWDVPARQFAAANSKVAVEQIAAFVREHDLVDDELGGVASGGGGRTAPARARPAGGGRAAAGRRDHPGVPDRVRAAAARRRGRDRADRGGHQQQGGGRAPAPGPARLGAAPRRRRTRLVRWRGGRGKAGAAVKERWCPSSVTARSCSASRRRRSGCRAGTTPRR